MISTATRALVSVLATTVFLGGCVAAAMAPSASQLAEVVQVTVVPVESRPLRLPGGVQSVGADVVRAAVPLTTAPAREVRAAGGGLALVGGVVVLLDAATTGTPTAAPARLEDVLEDARTWIPTVVLATEAAAQLSAAGTFPTVTTTTKYRRLPIEDRSVTWHMENWLKPYRAWYSDDAAGIDYTPPSGSKSLVLEIGLPIYEFAFNRLRMVVMVKAIDPATGGVVGRTLHQAFAKAGPVPELLSNDAAGLKQAFIEGARPLVATALRELGLVPR
jgi:hypothetical protein